MPWRWRPALLGAAESQVRWAARTRAKDIVVDLAFWLYVAFILVTVGWRSWLQRKRTGDHGFRRFSAQVGSVEWFAGILIAAGFVANFLSPVLVLADVLDTAQSIAQTPAYILGLLLITSGFALTFVAQIQMSASWRIGVDPTETTALVTHGVFGVVRNPIYAGLLLFALGVVMLVPNLCSFLGLLSATVGLELHVRKVEEPFLRSRHGRGYRAYTSRVGRFLPGVGCLD